MARLLSLERSEHLRVCIGGDLSKLLWEYPSECRPFSHLVNRHHMSSFSKGDFVSAVPDLTKVAVIGPFSLALTSRLDYSLDVLNRFKHEAMTLFEWARMSGHRRRVSCSGSRLYFYSLPLSRTVLLQIGSGMK